MFLSTKTAATALVAALLSMWQMMASSAFSIIAPLPVAKRQCRASVAFSPRQKGLHDCRVVLTLFAQTEEQDNHPFEGTIGKLAYHRLDIKSDGTLNPESDILIKWIKDNEELKNIWVISHGWNTSPNDAWKNYKALFIHMDTLMKMKEHNLAPNEFGVVGITWNSVTDDDPIKEIEAYQREIEAYQRDFEAYQGDFPDDATSLDEIKEKLKALKDKDVDISSVFESPSIFSKEYVKSEEIANLLSEICKKTAEDEDVYGFDFSLVNVEDGEPDGDEPLSRGLLGWGNPLTFHLKLKRAARLGIYIVPPVLTKMKDIHGLRVHLVGHSLGALLVSAAAFKGKSSDFASMTLLQGAFSQNAFAEKTPLGSKESRGMFRDAIENKVVSGPLAVTHTLNDKALKDWYRRAAGIGNWDGSTIPKLMAKADKKENILYSAIGVNGAQSLNENEVVSANLPNYPLVSGKINNLRADKVISEHTDVWNADIARLLIEAVKIHVL